MPPAYAAFPLRRCAALRGIRDDIEKEHAFLGLCALLRLNPQVSGRSCVLPCPCPLLSFWRAVS